MNTIRIAVARSLLIVVAIAFVSANAQADGIVEQLKSLFGEPRGRFTLVLVDTTESIQQEDWQLYERAFSTLLQRVRPGDRVVMAQVNDRPRSRFIAHADYRLEQTGNSIHDEVYAKRTREALLVAFKQLRDTSDREAKATLLLDAMGGSGEWFAQARARGQALQMLVLSDMIEQNAAANFMRATPTPAQTEQLIGKQRKSNLLPDLQGVRVQVVGASGRDASHMVRIREFWEAYYTATGASLVAYGRGAASLDP